MILVFSVFSLDRFYYFLRFDFDNNVYSDFRLIEILNKLYINVIVRIYFSIEQKTMIGILSKLHIVTIHSHDW